MFLFLLLLLLLLLLPQIWRGFVRGIYMAKADVPSSSASSSTPNLEKYDVFLSFRGEDTRWGFTSHLYDALSERHIQTFKDDRDLEPGDEIKPELLEAIERSQISVVIFSENYASSSWCLAELTHIMKCHKNDGKTVIPVFYDVNPSHVRKQEGSFGDAFVKRFNNDLRVPNWREVLCEATNLSGFDSKNSKFSNESAFVKAIAEDISRKLKDVPSIDDFGALIGIKGRIEEIKSLFSLDSPNTRVVGIWGVGGLGKTTLAEVMFNKVFNELSYQFDSRYFLANVREKSEKNGSSNELLLKLVRELLKDKTIEFETKSLPDFVKERLRRTKVLVVLDDVNNVEQLEVLLGDDCPRFCDGSRIIITTRTKEVLNYVGVDKVYEVVELSDDEAIQLFESIAFKGNSQAPSYRKLTDEVVKYAGGIPLVIKLLASRLRSIQTEGLSWEPILNELQQNCRGNIEKTFKISYDGLNDEEKAMFLDIACFFKGKEREFVEGILDGCGPRDSARLRMNSLIDKSFITIKPSDKILLYESGQEIGQRIVQPDKSIWMHDLLQDFGQNIVRQQSKERLGKRSRLCTAEDAYHVLNNNEGTEEIEGIFLDLLKIEKDLHLKPKVFQKMCNLRLLMIVCHPNRCRINLNRDLRLLPHSLRYIHWLDYPSKCFPSNFVPSNLVELHMPYSELEQLWDGVQDLHKLKCINLSSSYNLKEIPDLSRAPNLERIYLQHCLKLVNVPWETLRTDKLIELNLRQCEKLSSSLPEKIFEPSTLKILILDCYNVKTTALPETISRGLVYLNLATSGIQSLPSSIGSLENLSELNLYNCKSLSNIPSSIHKLKSLKYLRLDSCSSLDEFHVQLPRNLEKLDLGWTAIKEIPSSSIENCSCLQKISLVGCEMIESLPSNIFELRSLRKLGLDNCSNLKSLPEISKPMESLKHLGLTHAGIRQLPSSIENLVSIKELNLQNCANLESIPDSICKLTRLRTLLLTDCENLRSIPELPLSLNALDASGCTSLERVSSSKRVLKQWFRARHRLTLDNQNFFGCLKMDQNSRDEISSDYQLRVLAKAIQHKLYQRDGFTFLCYPGNEIPKWFDHQSEGSSCTIPLTPQWHNANFLGFAFCFVVDGKAYEKISNHVGGFSPLWCEFNFKIKDTKEVRSFVQRVSQVPQLRCLGSVPSNSDHLFLWYQHQDYNTCRDAVEVSLEFPHLDDNIHSVRSSMNLVQRCGIHMLNRNDLKDMEIDYECDVESDATHEDEPSEDEITDTDDELGTL